MTMDFKRRLPIPQEIKLLMPLDERWAEEKRRFDASLRRIFGGEDDRLLIVVGPCSADREDAVLEYCTRLAALQERVSERLILVPRVYTSKPRSTGDGYKGMLHHPDPGANADMLEGIKSIRRLHLHVVGETGLFAADEMLYPASYRYVSDLLSYVAVGTRSVENQEHRLAASGLEVPVGMKNPPRGSLEAMLNAVNAAQHSHMFIYRNWEVVSSGNPFAHCVLRGYRNERGECVSNYDVATLERLSLLYGESRLHNPAVIVDCNHANSGKKPERQPEIVASVMEWRRRNETVGRLVKGFMIESYLETGRQDPGGGVFGRSITDPCLGWRETEDALLRLADDSVE